ncbi:MAG TPA: hypothetical protein VNK41_01080 [Vicinamibacterales bacterium]|nr:hypothetical protein [Vicinamibacterales bacterium]
MPRPRPAKADLPSGETPRFLAEREQKEAYGRLLRAVQGALGKSRKEMAAILGVDDRQLGRWYAGTESPQVWRYHAIPVVRRTLRLIEALDDAEGAVVETTIRSRLDLTLEV